MSGIAEADDHDRVAGAAIILIAVGALVAFHDYEEWAHLIIGLWTVVAPWGLGFSVLTAAVCRKRGRLARPSW
jgi:hypothetical protein